MENKRDRKIGLIVIAVLLAALLIGGTALYSTLTRAADQALGVSEAVEEPAVQQGKTVPLAAQPETETAQQTTEPEAFGPQPRANLAKNFTVYTDEGEARQLIDLRGKPAVINFFASWCGPCKSEMPYFDEAYAAYGDQIEFMMVDLCAYGNDSKDNAKKLVAEGGWSFPVYFDTEGSAATAYAIRSMPMTIFVTADGELADKQIGAMTQAQLQAQIDALLAE